MTCDKGLGKRQYCCDKTKEGLFCDTLVRCSPVVLGKRTVLTSIHLLTYE